MRHIRFSIASLLIAILFVGFGFAALREANDTWDSSTFSITLVALLISILLAIHRTLTSRAFWLGFALFGSAYLALTFVPSIESRLITTRALTFLDPKMPRSLPPRFAGFDLIVQDSYPNVLYLDNGNVTFDNVTAPTGSNPAGNRTWSLWNSLVRTSLKGSSGTTEHFMRIGHSLLAIVAALLGGQLSRYLHKKNPQRTSGPVPAPVSIAIDSGA
jgi:hypothetical protein